jgi:hypothetical protein
VAVPVVDLFETVEVYHQHAEGPSITPATRHRVLEVAVQGAAIGQPGQFIGDGLRAQLSYELGSDQGGAARVSQHGKHLGLVAAEVLRRGRPYDQYGLGRCPIDERD